MQRLKKIINLDLILIIILAFLFALSRTYNVEKNINWLYLGIIFILSFVILKLLWPSLLNIKLKSKNKILPREFIIYGLLILIPLIIGVLAYYPAYTTQDTWDQWREVQTNSYSNWHPILHTLIFLKFPSLIYNNYLSATIFQCLCILGILIYFCYFLRKYFLNLKGTIIIILLMVLNPIFIKYSVTLWKDIPYSWFLFLGTLFLIEISLTNGDFLKKVKNRIFLLLSLICVLTIRHNGVVPFCLAFIFLIFYYPKYRKFLTLSFISIITSFVILTGPIYKWLNFDNKTGGRTEMMGVVMGQISSYYHNNLPFTKEELEILDSIVPLNIWQKNYIPSSFNAIKWTTKDFNERLDKKFVKVWKIYISKSIRYPMDFAKSYLNMTNCIWSINNQFYGIDGIFRVNRPSSNKVKEVVHNHLVKYNNAILQSLFKWLFIDYGKGLFIIMMSLFIIVSKVKFKVKKYIPFLLVLANTVTIMFLITGGEVRFIYSQVLCAIPLLLYSFSFNLEKSI